MIPPKSKAWSKGIEMLKETDTIEPSKSQWAFGGVMAKKIGGNLSFAVILLLKSPYDKRWVSDPAHGQNPL